MKTKLLRQAKGITLIALVVTIIVLLILAAVSINLISGENGILGKSEEAKLQTEIAREVEIIKAGAENALMESYSDEDAEEVDLTFSALEKELSDVEKYPNILGISPWKREYGPIDDYIKREVSLEEKENLLENLFIPASYGAAAAGGSHSIIIWDDKNVEEDIIYAGIMLDSQRGYIFGLQEHYGEIYLMKSQEEMMPQGFNDDMSGEDISYSM